MEKEEDKENRINEARINKLADDLKLIIKIHKATLADICQAIAMVDARNIKN